MTIILKIANCYTVFQIPSITLGSFHISSFLSLLHSIFSSDIEGLISVQLFTRVWLFVTPWTAAHQASLSTPTLRAHSNSCPLSQQCHPTISFSAVLFSFVLPSFPESGSFLMSGLFASGGQIIGASASASFLPLNIQSWFPLKEYYFVCLTVAKKSRFFLCFQCKKNKIVTIGGDEC